MIDTATAPAPASRTDTDKDEDSVIIHPENCRVDAGTAIKYGWVRLGHLYSNIVLEAINLAVKGPYINYVTALGEGEVSLRSRSYLKYLVMLG